MSIRLKFPNEASGHIDTMQMSRGRMLVWRTFLMLILESFAQYSWTIIPYLHLPQNKKLVAEVCGRIRSILVHAISMDAIEIE